MGKNTVGLGVVIVFALLIIAIGFGYTELTKHTIEVQIIEELIVPAGKNSVDGSYYLFRVAGDDRKVIELQRGWYMWGDNIDNLYFQVKDLKSDKVELNCFGLYFPDWYWYDQCYKINRVITP